MRKNSGLFLDICLTVAQGNTGEIEPGPFSLAPLIRYLRLSLGYCESLSQASFMSYISFSVVG